MATLLILSLMGAVVVSVVGTESYSAIHQAQSLDTYWIAEAGAHRALTYLSREDGTCTAISGAFDDVALGGGTFTVTATRYNPSPASLAADITAASTTISVEAGETTGFAPRGRIAIESELIDYTAISGNDFTGPRRPRPQCSAARARSSAGSW